MIAHVAPFAASKAAQGDAGAVPVMLGLVMAGFIAAAAYGLARALRAATERVPRLRALGPSGRVEDLAAAWIVAALGLVACSLSSSAGVLLALSLVLVGSAAWFALALGLVRVNHRFLGRRRSLELALLSPGAIALGWIGIDLARQGKYVERLTTSFAADQARSTIGVLALLVLALAIALRLLARHVGGWMRITAEAGLVPAAYGIALAVIYLFPELTGLEVWHGFQPAAVASAGLVALFFAIVPGRYRAFGWGALMCLFALITFGDLIYVRYFGNIMPILAISSGGQIWDVRDIIVKYTQPADAWLLLIAASAAAVPFVWPRIPAKQHLPLWIRATVDVVLIGTCLALAQPVSVIVDQWMQSDRSWRVLNGTDAVQDSGFIVAHAKEVARSLRDIRENSNITPQDLERVKRFHAGRAQEPPSGPLLGVARDTNLVLLQIEAMQEWVIGARFAGQEITPFLNELQQRSLYFTNVWDETGDSSTSDCEYMVLNSQFPLPQGSVAFRRDENHFVTLLHVFKEAGYSTFAGHAYHAGMWNRAVLYPKYGFDQTAFKDELGEGPKLGWGIGDKLFLERVMPRVKALRTPFVSLLVTLTSHGPFSYVPVNERKLKLGSVGSSEFGGYLQSMRYNDEVVELLFRKLAEVGLSANTTVVVYGDHDSRIKFSSSLAAQLDLSKETIQRIARRDYSTKQIPLFVVLPKKLDVPGQVVQTIGGQVDIGPTLLYLFGQKRPGSFIGRSLVPERAGHAMRIDGNAVDDERVYVIGGRGRCETFGDWQPLDLQACDSLIQQSREELEISWKVSLLDLAPVLAGRRPEKSEARR